MVAASSAASADVKSWQDFNFTANGPVRDLVLSKEAFAPLGAAMRSWVAKVENGPFARSREVRDALRITMLHLDIHDGRFQGPLDAVAELRSGIDDSCQKAITGLTTEAIVAARIEVECERGEAYARAFRYHFSSRLDALPEADCRADLEALTSKLTATREEAIFQDIECRLAPGIASAGFIDYRVADEIIRYRHKLADIIPLRDSMLEIIESYLAR